MPPIDQMKVFRFSSCCVTRAGRGACLLPREALHEVRVVLERSALQWRQLRPPLQVLNRPRPPLVRRQRHRPAEAVHCAEELQAADVLARPELLKPSDAARAEVLP